MWAAARESGPGTVLVRDNVQGLARSSSGFVAVTGLAHLFLSNGWLRRGSYEVGAWRMHRVAYLPAAPRGLAVIPHGLYATWIYGRAFVFTEDRLLGVASCVGGEIPAPR